MISGMYVSAAGAKIQTANADIIANNLANLSTTGFKRQLAIMRERSAESIEQGILPSLLDPLMERIGGGIALSEAATDFSEGSIYHTGSGFHAAIKGQGFFTVTDGEKIFYTRNGNFIPGPNGTVITENGKYSLLNSNLNAGDLLNLGGHESLVQFQEAGGVIPLYGFKDASKLEHIGEGLYNDLGNAGIVNADDPQGVEIGDYRIGYLEKSNVNPVVELTNMIEGHRAYEANMAAISSHDTILGRTVNDVGRIR